MASSGTTNTLLVGRAHERALLRELLDAAVEGRGVFLLIGGEAGIGKTTLVADLLDDARARDVLTLTGHSYDLTATPPYGPWLEILDSIRDPTGALDSALETARAAAGGGGPESFLDSLLELLSAVTARQPVVVVLEDLHWADAASLDALRAVARAVAGRRLLLIATYRREDVARGAPLYGLMPWLVRESQARRIDLRRLNQIATRELVELRYLMPPADTTRLVSYLQRYGEGNPLFIEELLLTLEYEQLLETRGDAGWALGDLADVQVPMLVRQMIDSRVDRLGAAARSALQVAAIIGQQAPFELWQSVSGLDEAALLDVLTVALDANVLDQGRGSQNIEFSHALIREALYDAMLAPLRRHLHRRVADVLLTQEPPDVEGLAYHLRQGGDPRMVEWLVRSGDRAERAYAWRDALTQFRAALEQTVSARQRWQQGWLLYRIGYLERFADVGRSLQRFDEAYELALGLDDATLMAYTTYARGLLRVHNGAAERGLPELEAGIQALMAMPAVDRLRLNATPGVFNPDAQPDLAQPGGPSAAGAVPLGTFLEGDVDRFGTYAFFIAATGSFDGALTVTDRFDAETSAAFGPAHMLGHVHETRAYALSYLGRPAEAQREYALARSELGLEAQYMQLYQTLILQLESLSWPYQPEQLLSSEIVEQAERIGRLADAAFPDGFSYQLLLLPTYLRLGRWAEMRALRDGARLIGGQHFLRQNISVALAWLAYHEGDAPASWRYVQSVLPRGATTEPGADAFAAATSTLLLTAQLHADAGHTEPAQLALEGYERWIAWSGAQLGRADGELGWARWEWACGALEQAEKRARRALELASVPRQPLALAAAQQLLGELATQRGDVGGAATQLRTAERLLTGCACPFELATCRVALAEAERARGDVNAAAGLAEAARVVLEPLAATPALRRVDALLAKTVARSPTLPVEFGGLTERELDVLRLVAEGLTDADVAERLYISPRTVGAHMRSIFSKLNVNSRAAAARIAGEHRLV